MRPLKTSGLPIAACLLLALGICQAQTVMTHRVRQATQDGTARFISNLSSTQTFRMLGGLSARAESFSGVISSDRTVE